MKHPRLPRNTRTTPVRLAYAIEQADKLELERLAAKGGVSAAMFVELMVRNLPLTADGLPEWLPLKSASEELPISPD